MPSTTVTDRSHPPSRPTLLRSIWSDLRAGRNREALTGAEQALSYWPDDIDALTMAATAALAEGRAEQAVVWLRRAHTLQPQSPQIRFNLALAEQSAGRHKEAVAGFTACLATDPDHLDARLGLSRSALAAGDAATAVAALRQLRTRLGDEPSLILELTQALIAAGDAASAEALARGLIAATPTNCEAWRLLALARGHQEGPEAAQFTLSEAVAAGAEPYTMAMSAAHLAHASGLTWRAAEGFAEAVRLRPDSADAWNNLAACQTLLNLIPESIHAARRAAQLAPSAANVLHTLAAALSRGTEVAQLRESLVVCEQILAQRPDSPATCDCAAIVLVRLGLAGEALPHAQRATALDPKQDSYRITLSRVLEQLGRIDEAETLLASRKDYAEASPELLRRYGRLRLLRRQDEGTVEVLDRAFKLAPLDQDGIAFRALALARRDGWAAADEWLGLHRFVRAVQFPLPDGFADLPAFNKALAESVRQHSQLRFEPLGLVARGGYLTGDLLVDNTPAIRGFLEGLKQAVRGYIDSLPDQAGHPFLGAVPRGEHRMHLWGTRLSAQGVIDTHLHEGSWLSGAYYVALPPALNEQDTAGWIEFGEPYAGLPAPPLDARLRVRPVAGLLLLFPSYLFHRTLPFSGDGERISISFDLGSAE